MQNAELSTRDVVGVVGATRTNNYDNNLNVHTRTLANAETATTSKQISGRPTVRPFIYTR